MPLGGNTYDFAAEAAPALTADANPVPVAPTVGNDAGETSVNTAFIPTFAYEVP